MPSRSTPDVWKQGSFPDSFGQDRRNLCVVHNPTRSIGENAHRLVENRLLTKLSSKKSNTRTASFQVGRCIEQLRHEPGIIDRKLERLVSRSRCSRKIACPKKHEPEDSFRGSMQRLDLSRSPRARKGIRRAIQVQ
jgi:hypothetical protein